MASEKPEELLYEKVCGNFLLARLNVKGLFERSVVWISHFSKKEGARGLILNRPMEKLLGECSPTFSGTGFARIPMYIGGPVESERLAILASVRNQITGDTMIQFGLSPDRVRELSLDVSARLFAFAGASIWEPEQLENELQAGTWLVVRPNFDAWNALPAAKLWAHLLGKSKRLDAQIILRAPRNLNEN